MIKAILFTTIISATLGAGAAFAQDNGPSTFRVFNIPVDRPHWGQQEAETSALAAPAPMQDKIVHIKKAARADRN